LRIDLFFDLVGFLINDHYPWRSPNGPVAIFEKTDPAQPGQNLRVSGENRSGRTRRITEKFTPEK